MKSINVRERHATGGYQEVLVNYSRDEIRDTFGTDDSSLVSVLLIALETAERERDSLQAKIDALMLEYCPDEMTEEQMGQWGESQIPAEPS